MRLRRIARPLARKGLSVIAAFLLSQFPDFRWDDIERGVTPVEIAADRNRISQTREAPREIGMQRNLTAIQPAAGDQAKVVTQRANVPCEYRTSPRRRHASSTGAIGSRPDALCLRAS